MLTETERGETTPKGIIHPSRTVTVNYTEARRRRWSALSILACGSKRLASLEERRARHTRT